MGAIDRGHWYRQADGSYRTMDMRFRAGKTRDGEHGGECWFLEDLITRKKRLCGSFRRCREDAAGYEDAVFQRPPGDYHVGDRAYTQKGDLVMISAIGKKGAGLPLHLPQREETGRGRLHRRREQTVPPVKAALTQRRLHRVFTVKRLAEGTPPAPL